MKSNVIAEFFGWFTDDVDFPPVVKRLITTDSIQTTKICCWFGQSMQVRITRRMSEVFSYLERPFEEPICDPAAQTNRLKYRRESLSEGRIADVIPIFGRMSALQVLVIKYP
jgi:hypothetical protein